MQQYVFIVTRTSGVLILTVLRTSLGYTSVQFSPSGSARMLGFRGNGWLGVTMNPRVALLGCSGKTLIRSRLVEMHIIRKKLFSSLSHHRAKGTGDIRIFV